MCPNEDRYLSEDDARNTFRACNVCPQTHELNAGKWKAWEGKERSLAQKYGLITIIAGPIYTDKNVRIKGGHVVPNKFFKIIIINNEPKYVLIFHQSNTETFVSLVDVEKLTGLKFEIFQGKHK